MAKAGSYHRDDLRAELLAAALAFVTENGHAALSIRELAQGVGVSPGAPYHHFPDKRALLLDLARHGFAQINRAAELIAIEEECPAERLVKLGRNFLEFCFANPRLFELMYDSELTRPALDPSLLADQNGFEVVSASFAAALPDQTMQEVRARVVAFWSTIYGFASLATRAMLDPYRMEGDTSLAWSNIIVRQAVGDV